MRFIGVRILIQVAFLLLVGVALAAQTRSIESSVPSELIFQNFTPTPMILLWVDYRGFENPRAEIKPKQSYRQSTFATNLWRIRDKNTNNLMMEVVAEAGPKYIPLNNYSPIKKSTVQ